MRTHFFAVLSLFTMACGSQHQADVQVIIPVEVQQTYSSASPGELVLQVETQGNFSTTLALGVLCEARDEPATALWQLDGSGCAIEAELTAWTRDADPQSTCEGPANTYLSAQNPPAAAWVGSAVIFEGMTTGCDDGVDSAQITLGAPR